MAFGLIPVRVLPIGQKTDPKTQDNKNNNIKTINIILNTLFPPLTDFNTSIENLVPEINMTNPAKTNNMAVIVINIGLVTISLFNI